MWGVVSSALISLAQVSGSGCNLPLVNLRYILDRIRRPHRASVVSGVLGISATILIAFYLWHGAFEERALIQHSRVVPATIANVSSGRDGVEVEYSYQTLAGENETVTGGYDHLDDIPGADEVVEVEYLPENPQVKRLRGTGNTSISQWKFWLILKCLLLIVFLIGSIWLLRVGLRDE